MRVRCLFIVLIATSGALLVQGQDLRIRSGFVEDSLGIGEPVHYWITATYSPNQEILFPDSNFNFTGFDYMEKYFEPSRVMSGQMFDTTVYTLQSFEIDPVQYLQLPVVLFTEDDSSVMQSPRDSIYFRELVPVATDTTSLKTDLAYRDVARQFNFPLLWIILGGLAVLALAVFAIFGKRIRKNLRIRRLRKDYLRFSDKLSVYIQQMKSDSSPRLAEEAISFWKRYIEKLESQPVSKYTTSEILQLEFTGELSEALRSIDRCIYAKASENDLFRSFQSIEDFTQYRYTVKLNELKDGDRN